MDCVITVKGNGVGKYGHTKKDRTKPLHEFLVDNQVLYRAVTQHLKDCSVCKIGDVLAEYRRRRVMTPKFKGQSSTGLVNRAIILERLAKKKKEVLPEGLVNELIWRGGPYAVLEHSSRLSVREKVQAFQIQPGFLPEKLSPTDKFLGELVQKQGVSKEMSEQELEDLVKIAEVMLS